MTRKLTLVAVVAMLALGTSMALAGTGSYATNDATAAQETTTTPAGQTTTVAETANVTFTNQTSNGSAVVVEEVVVPEGGFVAIHVAEEETAEESAENETEFEGVTQTETTVAELGEERDYTEGRMLGNSTYLEPGVHQNVTVQLNQTLNGSQILLAMPYQDTNDNQQFDFPEADNPYTQDGQPVADWASVTVEGGANETTPEGTETTTEEM